MYTIVIVIFYTEKEKDITMEDLVDDFVTFYFGGMHTCNVHCLSLLQDMILLPVL